MKMFESGVPRRPRRGRRVPVILQATGFECGAACLSMVLRHFGRKASPRDCIECAGAARDGTTAGAIARCARRFGLQVKHDSVDVTALAQVSTPAILFWNFNHFVVLEQMTEQGARIVDPARGRRLISPEQLDRAFTGIVLEFEPGPAFRAGEEVPRTTGRDLIRTILRAPGALALLIQILLASCIVQVAGLVAPAFTKILVDYIVPHGGMDALGMLSLGLFAVLAAQWVVSAVRSRAMVGLQGRTDLAMMEKVFLHLLALPFNFFQQRASGDLMGRIAGAATIRDFLTSRTISLVLDGAMVVGYLAILLTAAPLFGLIALVLGGGEMLFALLAQRRVRELVDETQDAHGHCQTVVEETISRISTIKSLGLEQQMFGHWSTVFSRYLSALARRGRVSAWSDTALFSMRTTAPLIVLWLGGRSVVAGEMSVGSMLAMVALVGAVLGPLTSLATSVQHFGMVFVHLRRLFDILEADQEQTSSAKLRSAPALKGQIEVRDVSFSYSAGGPMVLQGINVEITPGQKIALVGRTGSGKSTLAALLVGLHRPTTGEVFFDGHPLSQLDLRSVRGQLGVVLQDPGLFTGSIRENIGLGRPNLPLEDVMEAARMAALHDDVKRMPMDYETRLSGGASTLSGGQRQRLAIARALARNPAVLFLDEATSHLDTMTEAEVEQNLNTLTCTRIVIAHRLSTVRNADLILVLDQGRIVERGRHQELVGRGGLYASMIASQSGTNVGADSIRANQFSSAPHPLFCRPLPQATKATSP
jgi:ATP-binding cassette, subfamily B, bacterial